MRAKHVLYIITEYNGGLRPYSLSILKTIYQPNDKVVVVIREENLKNEFNWIQNDNIKFIQYPQSRINRILFRLYPTELIKYINYLIRERKIDIIYTLTGELILCHYIKRLQSKIKILHTIHDATHHDTTYLSIGQWLNDKLFLDIPNRLMIKHAKNAITNSVAQIEYLKKKYKNHYYAFSPFPSLITEPIANGNVPVKELENVNNYILFFGRIEKYKGIDLLYNLYCNNKDLQKYPLVIAGSGKIYFKLNSDINNIFIINRFIDDNELKDLFNKSKIVVYPYISGTQSGVLSLASFFGKRMVVSNIPFFKEIIDIKDNSILLTDVNNQNSFYQSILQSLNTDSNSHNFYKKNYSQYSQTSNINSIIDSI